ncbi:MAG: TVP38/TMEM64 family protein [Candidatus Omnitrophica bacterium]|nr:TVP38/TMEM64 family protein [Candidatus Omnitrophota bacterium]
MKFTKKPWLKLILGIVFIGVVVAIVRTLHIDFSQISSDEFKIKIDSFGIWGPIAYIILYIFRPLILLPAALTSASAGIIWGPLKGFIILQIGANLSAIGEFFIARYFARSAVEKIVKGKMAKLDQAIEKKGFLTVLLIRLIPNVAWDIQNLSLGLTKVKFRDYFLATLIGIMPGSFALVYFGGSLISALSDPANFWKIIVAMLLLSGVYYLQKFLRQRLGNKITPHDLKTKNR